LAGETFGGSATAAPQVARMPKAIRHKRTAFVVMPQAYRNAVSVSFR
jgi:hypothetical protein